MFQEQTCHINHIIFKQGSAPKFVYIIKEGDFQITRRENRPETFKDPSRFMIGPQSQETSYHGSNKNRKKTLREYNLKL